MTQFISVKFKDTQTRTYTYANSGEPVAIGDTVKVPTKDGWKTVTVHEVDLEQPSFACKTILGKVETKAEENSNA